MKKKFLLGISLTLVFAFLLTGCGSEGKKSNRVDSMTKSVVCTNEKVDDSGYKTKDEIVLVYDSSKVLNAKATTIIETEPDLVDFTVAFGQEIANSINVVDGVNVSYEKYSDNSIKSVTTIDYEKVDVSKIKSQLGELYDSDDDALYNGRGMTLEEFKSKNLVGYSCK